jgi:hypothetical protein
MKRNSGATRSEARRRRVAEDKFLRKYGYEGDHEQFFQNYRRRRAKLEADDIGVETEEPGD